jgi:diguanylate cyclase (GGDEF)-like protein
MMLKAFRNGVSDVVAGEGSYGRDLLPAVRRAVARLRKTRSLHDEIQHLARLARYDRLTGVPNHNFLEDRLAALVASGERHNRAFSILMIDLNKFTAINDVYGHAVGDQVLKAFSRKLMEASRTSDAFGRYGGDEFLYLIDQDVGAAAVEQACGRLAAALDFTVELDNISIQLSASIGSASYPADGNTADALLRVAEEDMLAAKVAGTGYIARNPGAGSATAQEDAAGDRRDGPGIREDNRRIEHRERVLRRGRIVLGDGYSTIDCLVRDISPHGARVTVQEGLAVPHNFNFRLLDTGRAYAAVRRWQRGLSIGLEFMLEDGEEAPSARAERPSKVA